MVSVSKGTFTTGDPFLRSYVVLTTGNSHTLYRRNLYILPNLPTFNYVTLSPDSILVPPFTLTLTPPSSCTSFYFYLFPCTYFPPTITLDLLLYPS